MNYNGYNQWFYWYWRDVTGHLSLWLCPCFLSHLQVKCNLKEDTVKISGGGLGHEYSALQFHFHWGSHDSRGSEHKVDAGRYAMEVDGCKQTNNQYITNILFLLSLIVFVQMHLVSKRADLSVKEALDKSNGLAVLGFFIEVKQRTKPQPPVTQSLQPTHWFVNGRQCQAKRPAPNYYFFLIDLGFVFRVLGFGFWWYCGSALASLLRPEDYIDSFIHP